MELRMLTIKSPVAAGVASVLINFVTPQFACAENYFDLSLEQLLETRVLSVSKKSETVANAPAAIYVVTSEDIARSGITNIPDALRMVPGVSVARSDANSWAVSIRGFNSGLANKLLVLVDGRSIYNPVFGGVLWEAHNLMLESIERIEVIRGPGGALWGANAVNGVINIITKHTRHTQGETVSTLVGNQQASVNARHGGNIGDDGTYRIYTTALNHENSPKPDGGEAYDEWNDVRAGFRADWGNDFTLQGDAYRSETRQLRNQWSFIAPYAAVKQQNIIYEGVNILGRWSNEFNDGSQLSLKAYVDWTKRDEPVNFIDDRMTYDAEVQYNFAPMGRHELVVGTGFRYINDKDTGYENVVFTPSEHRNKLYNVFFQDKIALIAERWFLTLGSKYEHTDYSGAEFLPNIRLQWHPTDQQMLWIAASKAVRTPTPLETDLNTALAIGSVPGTPLPFSIAFAPNDGFKSERLVAHELGYRTQVRQSVSLDIAAFHNDYDDLQTLTVQDLEVVINNQTPPHFLLPIKFTNYQRGQTYGVETALNWTATENLKLGLSYSTLRMDLMATGPIREGIGRVDPEQQAGAKIFWTINNSWTFDSQVIYVDELPGMKVDSYTRLDINLGGRLTKNLRVNLVGQNILEKRHREFGEVGDINLAQIERSIFAKLTWTL
jgi:iron complex outermembrane receptor protein